MVTWSLIHPSDCPSIHPSEEEEEEDLISLPSIFIFIFIFLGIFLDLI